MEKFVQFLIIAIVTSVLIAWADLAANNAADQAASTLVKDLSFFRVFSSIAATITLLIPAYWLFILQRRDGPSVVWPNPDRIWVRWERGLAHTFVVLVFVVTELFLRPTPIRYLGASLAALVILCSLVRLGRQMVNESLAVGSPS
jgi:hypothetical protein